ncbi:MAG: hypothetical protein WA948_01745 [Pontixanthobacter sp.]
MWHPPAGLRDAKHALRAGDRVERADDGGIRVAGGGRRVTLYSQ